MELFNEYRERSYFRMPGECNAKFQSLVRQIRDYCKSSSKGNEYRVLSLFLIQFLLDKHIITYGENRDLTVHYGIENADIAIEADKAFLFKMGPIPRNEGNIEKFKKLVPDISLPTQEYDLGSAVRLSRPIAAANRDVNLVNRFIGTLIGTGRFNCDHVEAFKEYAELYLRGYTTLFQRSGREGKQYVDAGGYEIAGKKVELQDFKYDPNYTVKYTTHKSLQQQAQTQEITQKDIILSNPNIVYLFFISFYIPTYILMFKNMGDTTVISDILIATNSIKEFEEGLEKEKQHINTNEDLDDDQREEQLGIIDDFISVVQDYKEHTEKFIFGVPALQTTPTDTDLDLSDINFNEPFTFETTRPPSRVRDNLTTIKRKESAPLDLKLPNVDLSDFK